MDSKQVVRSKKQKQKNKNKERDIRMVWDSKHKVEIDGF
jgi:hypothetical protein